MLTYSPKHPGIIKSIPQRWLFDQWAKVCRGERMPRWGALGAADVASCFAFMIFARVLDEMGRRRYFTIAAGAKHEEMHGSNLVGTYLDQSIPAHVRRVVLESYDTAVNSGAPVYTIATSRDEAGRTVQHERLILPFGEASPDHLMVMMEPYSEDGTFARRHLLIQPHVPAYALKAVIDPQGYQPQR